MHIRKFTGILFVLFFLILIFPSQAYAYLDPGTDSYFFQILIATILGAIFAVKLFFKSIVNFLRKLLSKDANQKPSAK